MRFKLPRSQILAAASPHEVQRILFDAVRQLDPGEVAELPADCVGVLANRNTDLHSAAVTLLHCDLAHRGEEGIGDLLRQLAELYASASVRISQLEHGRLAGSD